MYKSIANSIRFGAIARSFLYWILFLVFLFISGSQLTRLFPEDWNRFAYGILGVLAATLATYLVCRQENKSLSEAGLSWDTGTVFRFMSGVGIGTIIFAGILISLVVFSDTQVISNLDQWNPGSLFWLLAIIPLALMEEIAFRGYPFQTLNRAFGLWPTQVLVALVFAAYHIIQGWHPQVAFLGPGIWAFVFGLAAIKSKGIAVPTGIHVSLNMIQTLLGMKGEPSDAIWMLRSTESTTNLMTAETTGLMTQLAVLLVSLVLTGLHVKNTGK